MRELSYGTSATSTKKERRTAGKWRNSRLSLTERTAGPRSGLGGKGGKFRQCDGVEEFKLHFPRAEREEKQITAGGRVLQQISGAVETGDLGGRVGGRLREGQRLQFLGKKGSLGVPARPSPSPCRCTVDQCQTLPPLPAGSASCTTERLRTASPI